MNFIIWYEIIQKKSNDKFDKEDKEQEPVKVSDKL